MSQVNNTDQPQQGLPQSRLPRPSRLPVPQKSLRPSPSRDSMRLSTTSTVPIPRLRQQSREPLSRTAGAGNRLSVQNPPPLRNKASHDVFKKPARPTSYHPARPSSRQYEEAPAADNGGWISSAVVDEEPLEKTRKSLSERVQDTLASLPPSPAINRRRSSFFNPESPMLPPSQSGTGSRPNSKDGPGSIRPPSRQDISRPQSRQSVSRPDSRQSYHTQAVPLNFGARGTSQTREALGTPKTLRAPRSFSNLHISTSASKPAALGTSTAGIPYRNPPTPSGLTSGNKTVGRAIRPRTSIQDMFDHSSITEPVSPYQTIGRSPKSRQSINGYFDNAPEPGPAATPSSARTLKARPSLHGLYKKPSVSEMRSQPVSAAPTPAAAKLKRVSKPPAVKAISAASRAPPPRSPSPKKMSPKKAAPVTSPKKETAMKSSQTLRETIAAAKAAKKAAMAKQAAPGVSQSDITSPVVPNDSFDFGLDDPFNQGGNDPAKGLLRKRIDAARTDGRLNIAAMGFSKIPDEVMNMYNLEAINGEGGSWAESVDLTRFIAADNLFETLSDDVFPDRDREDLANDEDAQGNQFGGLETLDLHGNVLITLPMGLRRLEQLTVLNLSNNKLTDSAFDIISQIPSLRDLKLANNVLTGELSPSILQLTKLESLDLHKNKITSLPAGLSGLTQLRSFNVSENLVSSLPFDSLRGLPLTELLASSNKLSGTLIEAENIRLPNLKTFDVSCNAITLLASGSLVLPSLQILNISANRITALPSVETWESLMTLSAADNSITAIPEGFVTLRSVKIVDVAGNDIRTLDDRIALMESLTTLVISGNPLITKKWAGMNTADLKRALLARLEPAEVKPLSPEPHYASPKKARPESQDFFQHTRNISEASMVTAIQDHASDADTEYLSPSASAPATTPPLPTSPGMEQWRANINTALGCLDRSHTQSTSLNPLIAAQIAAENKIKTLELHHNMFGEIPASIAFFGHTLTSLNLSHNGLTSDTWLKEELELPNLVELNLSSNTFDSLSPILKNLTAPQLARLDVSFNRLTTLPTSPSLHSKFPLLGILLASNNTIRELSPLSIAGCRMVDVTSNEIERLDPRLGLLKELARFECAGNRFRVPNWKVVEKGTGSVLEWCRGRLSVEEIEEWEAREAERMGGGSPRKRGMVEEGEFGGQGWVL